MKYCVNTYAKPDDRGLSTRISLQPRLLCALGLSKGECVEAVVSPGVVILCRPDWVPVFERLLRDFPSAFICEAEAAPQKVSGPGGAGSKRRRIQQ
jgi:hypothetical protein